MNNIQSIERLPRPEPPEINMGTLFEFTESFSSPNALYILAKVAASKYMLIELNTGNRWRDGHLSLEFVVGMVKNGEIRPFKGVLIAREIP